MIFEPLAGLVSELFLNVQQRRHRWLNRLVWGAVIGCILLAIVLSAAGVGER